MKRCSRLVGLFLFLLAVILPTWAQDAPKKGLLDDKAEKPKKGLLDDKAAEKDKKDTKKDKKGLLEENPKDKKGKPKAAPEEKVVYGQTFQGKLSQMDANSQKDFSVQINFYVPDPNAQNRLLQLQQQLIRQMASLAGIRNPTQLVQTQQAIVQTQQQIAQTQQSLYKAVPKDVECRAAENIKVRSYYPPAEYDDKGNLKKWTAKELKALKGNSKLPGYPAEFDALKPGQFVHVYLAKQAVAPKVKGGLKVEEPMEGSKRLPVVMILVVREAAPAPR
jgi:hypothetical protein